MTIVLYKQKRCKYCADAEWVTSRFAREAGEELVIEDVDNLRLKVKGLDKIKSVPLICGAVREGDELTITKCIEGVPLPSELEGLIGKKKEEKSL